MTAPRTPHAGGTGRLGDLTVSRIGYGAMQLERLRADRDAAIGLLRRARELGATHVDTAQFYGDGFVNELIRDAYGPDDGVVVVTKVGADPAPGSTPPLRPAQKPHELRASVHDNLRSLGTDRIPVVNLRRLNDRGPGIRADADQRVDVDDQLAALIALRDEGTIGAIGLSGASLGTVRRALPAGIVCVQNLYSLVDRDDEDILRRCADEGVAWMPYFPLGGAFPGRPKVTDDPDVREQAAKHDCTPSQYGLAWLLHHAPNILLIPGTASRTHLEENLTLPTLQ
ncbi:aldo/keto reductase [Cryptosporangium japonicum]|uniref:Aldo/keto reductase n=1 Tax=Cryptosporangium japonicum TaxID=80872 RepID=A0ABN0TXF9_9ACTN